MSSEREVSSDHLQIIHNAVISAPTPKMLKRIEHGISTFVSAELRVKHAPIVEAYMRDVSGEYDKAMKACNLRRCLARGIVSEEIAQPKQKFRFKHPGRTENHSKFLRARKQLAERLFLPQKFVRFILHSAESTFPKVLNDFGKYRKDKNEKSVWFALAEFECVAERDLETNAIFIKEEWYPRIVRMIFKYYRRRVFPPFTWPRVMACMKGLINQQLTELKVSTFEHIFEVLSDRMRIPPIKFQAICGPRGIAAQPTVEDLVTVFENIFESICAVGTRLPALEPQIDRGAFLVTEDCLRIEIVESCMQEITSRLEAALRRAYEPVNAHVKQWQSEYEELFREEAKEELRVFLQEPKQMHEYLSKIKVYEKYDNSLRLTVRNEYFDCGIVNQTRAIFDLREIARTFISQITSKIVDEHVADCTRICEWFESVRRRAVETPATTEALLANSEFMLHVKNKKMAEVHEYIQRNLKVNNIISYFYVLS